MNKEVKINFSYVDHEWLIRFFEDGKLKYWQILTDSVGVGKAIRDFYFPNPK